MANPTPRPWFTRFTEYNGLHVGAKNETWGDDVEIVCTFGDPKSLNAGYIVECVNMHDDLVQALRDVYDMNFYGNSMSLSQIEALLNKAQKLSKNK